MKDGMTVTFEQFLLEDPLEDLQVELALRKELQLTPEEAVEAARWLALDIDAPDMKTNAWDKIWSRWGNYLDDFSPNDFESYVFRVVKSILLNKYDIDYDNI